MEIVGERNMAEKMCCDSVEVHEDLLKIVNETMPAETELYDLAELFKVFGNGIFYSRDEVHLTMMLQKSVQLCIRICV